jgi:phosphoglycerate dehydrogenase-like enzyme
VHDSPALRIAVLDDYLGVARELGPWDRLSDAQVTVFESPIGAPDRLVEALAPFDVVCAMRERTELPAAVIEGLPNLRLLVTTGMQNSSIDIEAARRRGVVVSGTGGIAAATVELTWALILGAVRHVAANDRGMRAGGWQRRLGGDLAGRRLGVIGLGRNGRGVAAIGLAFGMDVVAWSPNLVPDEARAVGVTPVTRDELLATADVITVHLRLGDRSRGLIGAAELALMQPHAILVNTSRGPIVDERALLDALREGAIGGAALDVYDTEPLPPDHPLRAMDGVLLSPHMGYSSRANMARFYAETVEAIEAWRAGAPIRVL